MVIRSCWYIRISMCLGRMENTVIERRPSLNNHAETFELPCLSAPAAGGETRRKLNSVAEPNSGKQTQQAVGFTRVLLPFRDWRGISLAPDFPVGLDGSTPEIHVKGSLTQKVSVQWMDILSYSRVQGCHARPCWLYKTGLAHWCTDGQWMHNVSIPSGPRLSPSIQYFQHTPVDWHAYGNVFQGKMVCAGWMSSLHSIGSLSCGCATPAILLVGFGAVADTCLYHASIVVGCCGSQSRFISHPLVHSRLEWMLLLDPTIVGTCYIVVVFKKLATGSFQSFCLGLYPNPLCWWCPML